MPASWAFYLLHLVWTETSSHRARAPQDKIGAQRRAPPSALPSAGPARHPDRPAATPFLSETKFCRGLTRTRRQSGSNSLQVSQQETPAFCRAPRPPLKHPLFRAQPRASEPCRTLTQRLPTRFGGHWQGRSRLVQLDWKELEGPH